MAKINIEYSSKWNAQDTFLKIRSLIEDNQDLQQIDKNYNCSFDEANRSGKAKGKQFEADLSVSEEGEQSKVQFHIKVGLMLTPFKSVIEEKLLRKLEKILS